MFIASFRQRLLGHYLHFLPDEVDLSSLFGVKFESGEVLEVTICAYFFSYIENKVTTLDIYTSSFFTNDPSIYCSHIKNVEKYLNGPSWRSRFIRIFSGYLIKHIRSILRRILKMSSSRRRLFTVINFECSMCKVLNNCTF